jgi:hypothetical protein
LSISNLFTINALPINVVFGLENSAANGLFIWRRMLTTMTSDQIRDKRLSGSAWASDANLQMHSHYFVYDWLSYLTLTFSRSSRL